MHANTTTHQGRLSGQPHLAGKNRAGNGSPPEGGEGACPAFGFLRGLHERANAIEFRSSAGNSVWLPYHSLGAWRFDPSHGLLLKFSCDVVYLVLITGTNLDRPAADTGIDLLRAGLQRHRILWMREMAEDEQESAGEGPFIDAIRVGQCEGQEQVNQWLAANAPAFAAQ